MDLFFSFTIWCRIDEGNEPVYKIHALTDTVNKVVLTAGRMPQSEDECVLDSAQYTEEAVGSVFTVTDNNDEDTREMFQNRTYTVVGLVQSPYYINFERGTTSIGDGRVTAFVYVPKDSFDSEYLTEVFFTLKEKYDVYTDGYEDYIDAVQDSVDFRYLQRFYVLWGGIVSPLGYGLSFLLTFVFAIFVNGIMFFKLEKINMAESLKSIE